MVNYLDAPAKVSTGNEQYDIIEALTLVPNPASSYVLAEFTLKQDSKVTIQLYNAMGQSVLNMPEMQMDKGKQRTKIIIEALPSGIYYIKINAGGNTVTQRLSIVK